jgi:hypothetical protein
MWFHKRLLFVGEGEGSFCPGTKGTKSPLGEPHGSLRDVLISFSSWKKKLLSPPEAGEKKCFQGREAILVSKWRKPGIIPAGFVYPGEKCA